MLHNTPQIEKADRGWKHIRKAKGPLRLSLLLWFARHGKLPVTELLCKRKGIELPNCTFCNSQAEDIIHVLKRLYME